MSGWQIKYLTYGGAPTFNAERRSLVLDQRIEC